MPQRRILGWKPDLPDFRDLPYRAVRRAASTPRTIDLRALCPPVYDQGQLGSCTGNAIAAALDFGRAKQDLPPITPSRLFIYYNERVMEGTVEEDAGAQIRNGIKSVAKQGACPEVNWPYDPRKLTTKPTTLCYRKALKYQALQYMRVNRDLSQVMGCLASGFPIVFGFSVYDGFMSDEVASTGVLKMPQRGEGMQGGHAVLMIGYDKKAKTFLVRNSWGTGWGMAGYFTMPFAYISNDNLSDDLWTIRLVE